MSLTRFMKPVGQSLSPDMRLDQARTLLASSEYDALPVIENERLVGVLTDQDAHAVTNCKDYAVAQIMRWRFYCYADDSVERSIAVMRDHGVTSLPVMDDSRLVLGMILLDDLIKDRPQAPGVVLPSAPPIAMVA